MAELFESHSNNYERMVQMREEASERDRKELYEQGLPKPEQMEKEVDAGTKAGPTLEPSDTEKVYTKYQEDPNVEIIDGKPFIKPIDKNALDVANEYTVTAVDRMAAVGRGVADFAVNVGRLVPWLTPAAESYDKKFGKETETDPVASGIRQVAKVLVPTLAIGGAGASTIGKAANNSVMLSARQNLLGRLAFETGTSSVVTAIDPDSYTDTSSAANLLNDLFGLEVPWMHIDGDSPYWTYAKNMIDDLSFSVAGGVLEAFTASRSATRHIAKNEETAKFLGEKFGPEIALTEELGDRVAARVQVKDDARLAEINRETIQRLGQNADNPNPYYDPFLNEPHFPSERSVKNYNANVLDFKTDLARLTTDGHPKGARARPAITDGMKAYLIRGNKEREEVTKALARELNVISADTQIEGELIPEELKLQSVDQLLSMTADLDSVDLLKKLNNFKNDTTDIRGTLVKTLGPTNNQIAQEALDRMIDILSPDTARASSVIAYQAANDIADSALAINLGKGSNWTARQQEQLIKNIPVLMQEIRAQKYIAGYALQMENMMKAAKRSGTYNFEWITEQNEKFSVNLNTTRLEALEMANELISISQEKPEFFLPLYKEMVRAKDNSIKDLDSLNELMKQRMGFWNSAFFKGSNQVPSLLINEMQAMRYNSVLYGRAPLNAGYDAFQTMVLKPLTMFAGLPASSQKVADLKKAIYVYGGFMDVFKRAVKYAADEWSFSLRHPDFAHSRGTRADLDLNNPSIEGYDTFEMMMKAWEKDKKANFGKLAVGSIIQRLTAWNRLNYKGSGAGAKFANLFLTPRAGVNGLAFDDGFTKSFQAASISRYRAYDKLSKINNGVIDSNTFKVEEQKIYDSMFDKDGLLIDPEAVYLSKEANLNLDNDYVAGIEQMVKSMPILRTFFMFPRTGANHIARVATFAPTSPLGIGIANSRRVLFAKTTFDKEQALIAHGIDKTDMAAFDRLRQEYVGRQNMGGLLVTAGAAAAYMGLMTSKGPTNHNERRRWEELQGWKPMSLRVGTRPDGRPIWWSYEGTQFETLFGLISDIVFHRNKVDEDASEWFRTLASAVSLNVTNKTMLNGLEPIVALIHGDESAVQRLVAREINTLIPGSGMRNMLSSSLDENLNDVKNHWTDHLAHMNRFLPGVGDNIIDEVDIYNGRPIGYESPMIMDLLNALPFGRVSTSIEPWRMRLLESGWDNKESLLTVAGTGIEYTDEQRRWINHYVGTKTSLGSDLEELLMRDDNWYKKQIEEFKKSRPSLLKQLSGQTEGINFDWKKSYLYEQIDKLHVDAYDKAKKALLASDEALGQRIILQKTIDNSINRGDGKSAAQVTDELIKFNSMNPPNN